MEKQPTQVQEVVNYFFEIKGWANKEKSFYSKNKILYGRYTKPARELLILTDNDLTQIKKRIKMLAEWCEKNHLSWSLETVIKRWNDFKDVEDKLEPYSTTLDYFEEQNKLFNKRYGEFLK